MSQPLAIVFATSVAAALGVAFLIWVFRRIALPLGIVDRPNARSSHSVPVVRGAGLAIVLITLAFLLWASGSLGLPFESAVGIGGGALLVAAVGLVDDVRTLSAKARLAVHVVAAIWASAWLGWLPSLDLGVATVDLGGFGYVLPVIGLVWSTNLYNFMDGTDGLAGVEGFSVAAIAGFLLVSSSFWALGGLALVVSASCLGFLWWNWPPARVFMGDVGSGFLGFVFGALAIASENVGAVPVLLWASLASVFIVDATITFVRRVRRGVWQVAHRTHAYQRLVQAGWSHGRVAGTVLGINLLLGCLAAVATRYPVATLYVVATSFSIAGMGYAWVERKNPFFDVNRGPGPAIDHQGKSAHQRPH